MSKGSVVRKSLGSSAAGLGNREDETVREKRGKLRGDETVSETVVDAISEEGALTYLAWLEPMYGRAP